MMFFSGYSILITLAYVFIIGVFIYIVVKRISQWGKNNSSLMLSVPAVAVAKRIHHQHEHGSNYYVTFQFESGDRSELSMSGREYGMIAEQDFGTLTFQGTRYISFERV